MSNWIFNLIKEVKINKGLKSRLIIILYRISSLSEINNFLKFFVLPVTILNYFIVDFIMGVEIKPKTKIGWGLIIYHPTAIIINPDVIIGNNFIIRHCVTIGNKFDKMTGVSSKSPVIGNDVEIGANSTIIGNILIGNNVIIGANVFLDYSVNDNGKILPHRGILYEKNDS